jgi:hypothetical protein
MEIISAGGREPDGNFFTKNMKALSDVFGENVVKMLFAPLSKCGVPEEINASLDFNKPPTLSIVNMNNNGLSGILGSSKADGMSR